MAINISLAAILFVAPLESHTAVKIFVYLPVELVDVDRVQPALEAIPFGAELAYCFLVVLLLVTEARAERRGY